MRPASTVVLPEPGPARTPSGPSPASTIRRWLGEKSLRSIHGASQRWQLFRTVSIACQLLPPKQKAGVEQVEQLVTTAIGRGKAADEGELLLAVLVSHEEIERIGCVAQRAQNG